MKTENKVRSVFQFIYQYIENYTNEELNKITSLFQNSKYKFELIDYFISQIQTSFNCNKIISALKLCVCLDLIYTRNWFEENIKESDSYFPFFLIVAIIQTFRKNYNENISKEKIVNFVKYWNNTKNHYFPERSTSLSN